MKNAIEAEKAKSAKIENDLKLEIEKLKAKKEADVNSKLALELDWQKRQIYLAHEEQVIINQDLKIALQKQYRDIYNLKAENEKMKSELEVKNEALLDSSALLAGKCTLTIYLKDKLAAQQSIINDLEPQQTIVADLKSKLYCRNVTIRTFKCELEHKDKVIERLYAIINKR